MMIALLLSSSVVSAPVAHKPQLGGCGPPVPGSKAHSCWHNFENASNVPLSAPNVTDPKVKYIGTFDPTPDAGGQGDCANDVYHYCDNTLPNHPTVRPLLLPPPLPPPLLLTRSPPPQNCTYHSFTYFNKLAPPALAGTCWARLAADVVWTPAVSPTAFSGYFGPSATEGNAATAPPPDFREGGGPSTRALKTDDAGCVS